MPRIRLDNVGGTITDGSGITSGATSFHDSVGLQALGPISAPDYACIVFEPRTANMEKAYIMAYGQKAPFAPMSPQLVVAYISNDTKLVVNNGPLYTNGQQVRVTTPDGTINQIFTVGVGSTRTNIVVTGVAIATLVGGSRVQPLATSTVAAGSYGVKATYVTADGETDASFQSSLIKLVVNADQLVMMVGAGQYPIPAGVTSVKFYKTVGPGNQGLLGSVASGSFVSGVAIFQTTGAAVGDNANFAPTVNGTVNASTAATIWRGREGSAAVAHALGKPWSVNPTAQDHERANKDWWYLPSGWDDGWLYAQWDNANKLYCAAGFGTSIFEGGRVTSNWIANAYWPLILNIISARPGITRNGDFYACTYSTSWWSAMVGTAPWVMDHAPVWARAGWWMAPRQDIASAAPIMHFTSPGTMRSAEIIYLDAAGTSGLTATYDVDGGANQTITFTGSGTLKRTSAGLTGLSAAAHTIHFTANGLVGGTTGSLFVLGVWAYVTAAIPTTGLIFGWSGAAGLILGALGDPGFLPSVTPDAIATFGGPINASIPYQWGFGPPTAPDLAWIDIPNDVIYANLPWTGPQGGLSGTGYGPVMFEDRLRDLVCALRAGNPRCSIVFHICNLVTGLTSDVPFSPDGDLYNASVYIAAINRVAQEFRCAVLDTNRRWDENGPDRGFQNYGDDHPEDPGHSDIAAAATVSGAV